MVQLTRSDLPSMASLRAIEALDRLKTASAVAKELSQTQSAVSRQLQLLDRVWGRDIYVDTRTVDVHVGRLRKALCQHGGDDPLRTVRGAGYALG